MEPEAKLEKQQIKKLAESGRKIEKACIQYKRKKFKKRKLFHIFTKITYLDYFPLLLVFSKFCSTF